MKPWRERGFVPDSDEEDGFESQDSNSKGLSVVGVVDETVLPTTHAGEVSNDDNGDKDGTCISGNGGNLEHLKDAVSESAAFDTADKGDHGEVPSVSGATMEVPQEKTTSEEEEHTEFQYAVPSEGVSRDVSVSASGGTTEISQENTTSEEEKPTDTSSTRKDVTECPPTSPDLPPMPDAPLPSTPPAKKSIDIFDFPSSSPDVLQFDHHPVRRQTVTRPTTEKVDSPIQLPSDDGSSSPLSSPPSSLHSPRSNQGEREEAVEGPHDNLDGPHDNLDNLLPPLDIPEEILRELDQPTRRSLRQRNPIQLHPYLLEDARYQRLMKARGLKPVRVLKYQHDGVPPPADDSQGLEFVDVPDPPSSSPGEDFQLPPPSPVVPHAVPELIPHRHTPGSRTSRDLSLPTYARTASQVREVKRRKLSHPNDNEDLRRQRQHFSRPRVIVPDPVPPEEPESNSIWDLLPSPPQSGSTSSTPTTHASGFRFPLGFTPPVMTTPITEPTPKLNDADEVSSMDWSGPGTARDPIEIDSSSRGEPDAGPQAEPDDSDVVVRQLQRKIKGVLPASWLRLDLKQQEEKRLTLNQRYRDMASSHRPENVKGVARKIIKSNSGAPTSPGRRLMSTRRIFDYDDNDNEEEDGADNAILSNDPRKELPSLAGFNGPFDDQAQEDGDMPEDNRIDYMFPPTSRGEKRGIKRRSSQKDGTSIAGHWKRARLKWQTRITDAVYGGQRQRRPSPKPPKLGVLDAPDVVERPRKEQPQFLRIAARQARSRRDGGRRSPTHKFFRLSSRLDTEDANTSLREWRRGAIRQTKLLETRSKPRARPPLIDLTTNELDIPDRDPRGVSVSNAADPVPRDEKSDAAGDATYSDISGPTRTSSINVTNRKSAQSKGLGNKWVIRRHLAVSSLKRNAPRPTEPELANPGSSSFASPSLFHRSLTLLNRNYRHLRGSQRYKSSLTLDRFLSDNIHSAPPPNVPTASVERSHESDSIAPKIQPQAQPRQVRKRPPKRLNLDVEVADQEQPLETLSREDSLPPSFVQPEGVRFSNQALGGLTSFQRSYSLDFNTAPLYSGTFFHESTFVGSGEFARSLEVLARDLDKDAGLSIIHIGDLSLRWGAWNDTVSSELGIAFERITEDIERNGANPPETNSEVANHQGCAVYRSLINYVTHNLFFIDPIDRTGFVERALGIVCKLNENLTAFISTPAHNRECFIRTACYNMVFANQAFQVASHALVDPAIVDEALDVVKTTSKQLIAFVASQAGLDEIRQFLEDNKLCERREAGIRGDRFTVEAYVVAQHVLHSTEKLKGCFEAFVEDALLPSPGNLSNWKDVPRLENGWHSVFTILPLDEINRFGITRAGSRFKEAHDNWPVAKRLLHPVLNDYITNSSGQLASFNHYCRVLFNRCFRLINYWGWRDCKPILDTLFDFFAKNTLYNLNHEETFGSPSFLEELERNPSLDIRPGEPCFHILLKVIGSGLRFMSKVYDKKKIRNFAWRLLPNHGRVYPKEKPLRQEDLDALRNHHDLLCTLYWAVPEGCRPRLEAIRNLVHPATSHRETCNISLRSWTRLVRFKLSTEEDVSGLDSFADWHSYFVTELLKQHSLARTEIEAQSNADSRFSRQIIESTISQNQRQIESLLSTALRGLKSAVQLAPTLEHARILASRTPFKAVLGLFSPKLARVNTVVSEALQIIVAYVQKDAPLAGTSTVPVSADEDSQEYGDWSDIEAIYGQELSPPTPGIEHVEKVLHPAVSRLVSNCFGEDHCPEDAILLNVVDCWSFVAHTLVKHGLRHWDGYLSPYDGDSWATLRATVQTRKFTPRFLASCIEKDTRFLSECKAQVLGMWMSALVERTSMLKFQHDLTEALLNRDSENPLLKNLPFSRDRKSGRFSITLEDFSQRRLSLISSLLSNMREHVQGIEDARGTREFSSTKQEYKELIEKLMTSMKANYQELGNGAAESAQGAYVNFVQCIVGFLQQHTRDIGPIDPFFTDPTTFPLPSTDPTYIVAKLKSYEPKLSAEKVARTLIIFIQGVSERAAIDDQQVYLVDQLCASMSDTYEGGNPSRPTLRAVLLQCVFPAYLETAFSNAAAWILSRPILQTISRTFKDSLFNMDTTDPNCVQSVMNMLHSVFQSSYQALQFITDDPDLLKEPSVLLTASSFIEMMTSALPAIDYIDRVADTGERIISQIRTFGEFAQFAVSRLRDEPRGDDPEGFSLVKFSDSFFGGVSEDAGTTTAPSFFREARHLASRELQAYIHESWSKRQGKYYFTRRGCLQPQEVGIDPTLAARLEDSPETVFVDTVKVFLDVVHDLGLIDYDEVD